MQQVNWHYITRNGNFSSYSRPKPSTNMHKNSSFSNDKFKDSNMNYEKNNNNFHNNINTNFSHSDFNEDTFKINKNENNNSEDYDQFFEIFGIKLYFDDLLILALLFFLYKEEVKDNYLYIVLFLLLFN